MATSYREDYSSVSEECFGLADIVLPPFPKRQELLRLFPGLVPDFARLNKTDFMSWLDFSMEHPDEVWETSDTVDGRLFYYISFMEENADPPVFAAAVQGTDRCLDILDYTIVVKHSDLRRIRTGQLLYSRKKEWEKEELVRTVNEKALKRYDEDRLDEARELVDAAIRLCGDEHAYLFNNRGLICWKMGDTEQAKKDFIASAKLDDTNGDPYYNIGLIYLDEANHDSALHYLQKAVEIDPTDSQFLTELGHLYLDMRREKDALELFQRARENNPEDPQVDFHLGYYYLYRKRVPRNAVRHYRKGLEKDPQDQFALVDLAVAYWYLGNKNRTREILDKFQSNSGLMPYTINRLVYLNVEMDQYENAIEYCHIALGQSDPFEPQWLHYYAAIAHAKSGEFPQATEHLKRAVQVGGSAVVERAAMEEALEALLESPDFREITEHDAGDGVY